MTILAVDLGTSAIKFLRTDRYLNRQSLDRVPVSGLAVGDWLHALRRNILDHGDGADIGCIAITGQMHGLMTLENDGFGTGIPWTDRRAAQIATDLNTALGPEVVAALGGPIASGFLAASLAWLRTHDPNRWRKISSVMLPKDAFAYALTGHHVTDPTDAAGTGLLDIASGTWNTSILDLIGIPTTWMPEIRPSGSDIGSITPTMAATLGLSSETRVVIAGGDASVGAFGAGLTNEGEALLLLSTGAQVLLPSRAWTPNRAGRWYTWPSTTGGCLRVGTLLNAGNAIDWSRTFMKGLDVAPDTPTSLIALPHLIGERTPIRDTDLRGAILGITPETSGADIHRAMMEGVACALRHTFESMCDGHDTPESVRIGGGGTNITGMQQVITDVLGIPTRRIETHDLTVLGAAALAAGVRPEPVLDAPLKPNPERTRQYNMRYAIYREALDATRTISQRLTALAREETR